MFSSLKGKARQRYQHCDKKGNLTPAQLLIKLNMVYNASVDFQDLNAQLCTLKQRAFEYPKDYYDRMVDIGVTLQEYHSEQFQPDKLSHMEKDCFYSGLHENC